MASANEQPVAPRTPATGNRWALGVSLAAMAVTCLPYLFGMMLTGAHQALAWFSWLGYNLDDSCVYLSWMRQVADGSPFQRNLFTVEPQAGHQFNVLFLALGLIARFTGAPLLLIYHGARIVAGLAFLRALWWLLGMVTPKLPARKVCFLTVLVSAGVGWLPGQWRASGINSPADVWQPEAITWLCLYLSPLFLVSLLLMVGVLGWLLRASRTGSRKAALLAGGCGLLLGNIHTYDVITLIVVWVAWLGVTALLQRRLDVRAWLLSLGAGALTGISSAHMLWIVRTEAVFAKRVAVATLSPSPMLYVLGYGLLLPLALGGLYLALRRDGDERPDAPGALPARTAALFLFTWAAANLVAAYLPVPFQRKMLMGAHLPIACLAGLCLASAAERVPVRGRVWAVAAALALLGATNVRFMLRDTGNFSQNRGQSRIQRPYMHAGEVSALLWLREHTRAGEAVQPLPWVAISGQGKAAFVDTTAACFAPGLTGRAVHAGHWGETPDFGATMGRWVRFQMPGTPDAERRELLRASGVRYLLFSQLRSWTAAPATRDAIRSVLTSAPYLRLQEGASSDDAEVYEVVEP
jgi:hypothetical protein